MRPRGSQLDREKRRVESFQARAEEPLLLSGSFPTRKGPSFVKKNLVFTENKPWTGKSSSVCRKTDASCKLITVSRVLHCASRVYASVIFYQWILLANSKTAALTSQKFFFGSVSHAVFLGGWNYSRKETDVLAGYGIAKHKDIYRKCSN